MEFLNEYILLPVLPVFVIVFGIYFTLKLKLYKPKKLLILLRSVFERKNRGGISPFAALTVALAGTLGVGNITGVAVALALGGAGSVFWMWVSAVCTASLKYAEVSLAVKYKEKNTGGPMYYISKGLHSDMLAKIFCVMCLCCSLISGPSIQINSAACALYDSYGVPKIITGAVIALICFTIVNGGLHSVSKLSEKLIPLVTGMFLLLSCIIIFSHADMMSEVLNKIFNEAFNFKSLFSGIGGYGIASAVKHGMAKGVLSHEAGSGTSSISHAGADAASPSAQGALGMIEVAVDTLIMCSATAFVILLSGVPGSMDGTKTVCEAYSTFLGSIGTHFISLSTVFFALATILCWSYYGTVCVEFFTKNKKIKKIYIIIYCIFIAVGSVTSPALAWQLTDFFTCTMTFLNTACLVIMSKEIRSLTP